MDNGYPPWVGALPRVAVNFPGAEGRLMTGPHGQTVFWSFPDGGSVPAHEHGAQMGVVLSGAVHLTVNGRTVTYQAGQHFAIEAGHVHSAEIAAGSEIIELFEEPDRHRACA
jgi:quercetin dioxygenase-like cupin family protein